MPKVRFTGLWVLCALVLLLSMPYQAKNTAPTWEIDLGSEPGSPVTAVDGSIYVTTAGHELVKINDTGTVAWRFSPTAAFHPDSTPISIGRRVYLRGSLLGESEVILAVSIIRRDLDNVWTNHDLAKAWATQATKSTVGPFTDPDQRTLYDFTSPHLRALNLAGEELWSRRFDRRSLRWSAQSIGPRFIFISERSPLKKQLLAFDKSSGKEEVVAEATTWLPAPAAHPADRNVVFVISRNSKSVASWSRQTSGKWKESDFEEFKGPIRSLSAHADGTVWAYYPDLVIRLHWNGSKLSHVCTAPMRVEIDEHVATGTVTWIAADNALYVADEHCAWQRVWDEKPPRNLAIDQDDTLYFSDSGGILYKRPVRSKVRQLTRVGDIHHPPSVDGKLIVVPVSDGLLFLSKRDGSKLAEYRPRSLYVSGDVAMTNVGSSGASCASLRDSLFVTGTERFFDEAGSASSTHKLYALGLAGDIKWSRKLEGEPVGSPVISQPDSVVVATTTHLYEFSKDGEEAWKPQSRSLSSAPSISSEAIYVGCKASDDLAHTLCKFSRAGVFESLATQAGAVVFPPAIDTDGTLWTVIDQRLFQFDTSLNLVSAGTPLSGEGKGPAAIDSDGKIWVPTEKALNVLDRKAEKVYQLVLPGKNLSYGLTPAITESGSVYYSIGHHLWELRLDADGTWSRTSFIEAGDGFATSAPVIANSQVVIGAEDHKLYATGVETSLADSSWPMYYRDQFHSGSVPF